MDLSVLAGVTHPSDFATESLRKLDGSLRCAICKEFFDAPVLLHCGHTFCSLCIRSVLPNKPECPTCRMAAKETHLIRNSIVDEAVNSWSDARRRLLDLDKQPVQFAAAPSNKRKLAHSLYGGNAPEAGPSRLPYGADATSTGSHDEQTDEMERPRKAPRHSSPEDDVIPSSDPDEQEWPDLARTNPPIACPLCGRQVQYNSINPHMDSKCQTHLVDDPETETTTNAKPNSKAAWGSIFKGHTKKPSSVSSPQDLEVPTTRLAKVSYGLLTITGLRKLLAEKGLPTNGGKDELITRHERWIALFNANLDRARPKTVGELKGRLKEIEETGNRPGPKKVMDERAWTRRNKDQFTSLIEAARPKTVSGEKSTDNRTTDLVPPSSPGKDMTSSSSPIIID